MKNAAVHRSPFRLIGNLAPTANDHAGKDHAQISIHIKFEVREPPDKMSALEEGEGGHGKAYNIDIA